MRADVAAAAAAGFEVAIVTGDKDFFQLVDGAIKVYNPRDDGTWFDAEGVKEKFGVHPSQVVDVLALMGDSIDNIKGVAGIGEKGARDLIAQYGSLEELLAHAAEVPNKRYREGLLNHAEDARQSRELARIRTDVPVAFDPEALRYRGASRERCFEIFNQLAFRTIVAEYAPTADTIAKTYRVVNTADGVRELAGRLRAAGRLALRVLPDRPSSMRASIVGLAFSTSPREADYVPIGHHALGATENLPLEAALDALRPVLEADPQPGRTDRDESPPGLGADAAGSSLQLRAPQRLGDLVAGEELPIEGVHQLGGGRVLDPPERPHEPRGARGQERAGDSRSAGVPGRLARGLAARQDHQASSQAELADLVRLQQAVATLAGSEQDRRAVRSSRADPAVSGDQQEARSALGARTQGRLGGGGACQHPSPRHPPGQPVRFAARAG